MGMKILYIVMAICCSFSVVHSQQNKEQKAITILMVTHNAREYIERALCSVFDQNYENYTLLVMDDCSDDDTVSFIKKYTSERGCSQHVSCRISKEHRKNNVLHCMDMCKSLDSENIVVVLSPQDFFTHDEVLSQFNNIYIFWKDVGRMDR